MKRILHIAALAVLLLPSVAYAQQAERLSVATINIDGLPKKILVFNVKPNGPGAEGTSRIGKYLKTKNYDIACLQEDFNYHDMLTPWLEDDFTFDAWTGAVGIDIPGKKIDFLHLQNEQFECDGLGAVWKKSIYLASSERHAWESVFGKFSHGGDALVTKGYRRMELTLASGARIVVYNMHMDASSKDDEKDGTGQQDRDARLSEWRQLLGDVLAHIDTRPIIVMGDMNSYYCRDQVKAEFIDKINETGRAKASDVWVELERNGVYPAPKEGGVYSTVPGNILDGELFDKIIYINPVNGTKLKPLSYHMDVDGYMYEGKPLGDHYPVSATFEVQDIRKSTAIDIVTSEQEGTATYYNLKGQRVSQPADGVYIEQKGQMTRKRVIK